MEFKGPDGNDPVSLDYVHDLTAELGTDTISTSTWALDSGITKDSDSTTTTAATIWVSGGTLGMTYRLANTAVTVSGRVHVKAFYLRIQEQRAG
jgi:hypothetical protein